MLSDEIFVGESKSSPSGFRCVVHLNNKAVVAACWQVVSPLLDVVYKSDEKERVVPFLSSAILQNVFPYLKHHR